ncbi:MAG TPA: cytochrome c3 family protein [Gemmatimonadales bacterium]|nr:cytochrome c3 family protein [Gemmatimonadales bacterium]
MRKSAFLVGGAVAAGLLAAVLSGFTVAPQGPQGPADPAAAPAAPYTLSASDTAALKGPRQPVFFRHDIHAGQYQISCQYCHYSAAVSSEPGIPSMQTCMGCHLIVAGADSANQAEIAKVRESWNTKKPIEWERIHYVARHVHFPHQRHIKAMGPNACATCHGDVARMAQVWEVNHVNNMGWCINCHLERKVNRDCTACHY